MDPKTKAPLNGYSRHTVGLVGDTITRNALLHPEKEAFVYADRRISFREYNQRVNSLIHALQTSGVRKGDTIGVLSWNCLEYADIFGAAGKGGFIVAPFNVRSSASDLEYLIKDSGAKVLFVGAELGKTLQELRPNIPGIKYLISLEYHLPDTQYLDDLLDQYPSNEPIVDVKDEAPFLLLYTSGTTGLPKGALYTQEQYREGVLTHSLAIPLRSEDKGFLITPLFHIGGVIWYAAFLRGAATNVLMKQFDPKATLEIIEKERITALTVVPTQVAAMLEVYESGKYDLSCLNMVKYMGSPMPADLLKRGIKAWGMIFLQGYGQTETGPDISTLYQQDHDVINEPPELQKRLMSCGRPAPDVQVRIVDSDGNDLPPYKTGEIIVRSRHLMQEYWNKPKETEDKFINGWLRTGDLGYYDEDCYFYIADRKEDMIVSGGENVFPREVEETLYTHPAVRECAVFGIPDPKWVEKVHAVVSLKVETTATPDELIEFCKANIARYKAPKSIEIVEDLPKGGSGKILKGELKKRHSTNENKE
ncbi:MAG: long-chain-fatty-acid--CoA ligase [Dehalococcoidia bacterium]